MVLEVKNQVYNTFDFLNSPEPDLYEKIINKDDYIDNLKNVIENKCFSKILPASGLLKQEINKIRAIHIITVNLERIGDFCVNITEQMKYLSNYKVLYGFNYEEMLTEIVQALASINSAMRKDDLSLALDICRSENKLDKMYEVHFKRILREMSEYQANHADYITILFIVRYLERIGDSLLNVGEAIIFNIIGEKIKINQFQALQQNLDQTGFEGPISEVDFQGIWGTRSGCRIGRVEDKQHNLESAQGSIFKEGSAAKISGEKINLEKWQEMFPGLVPKVFSHQKDEKEDKASMLLEFLPGCTLDEEILTAELSTLRDIYFKLEETLSWIWNSTLQKEKTPTDYLKQLNARRESVIQVHPEFKGDEQLVHNLRINSLNTLLEKAAEFEKDHPSTLTIFIHGDFNINNIVYYHNNNDIYFIDLHRSRQFDYLQDVSVFLVSNFRTPVFDPHLRKRLNWITEQFYGFARKFAERHGDDYFEPRLAIALARSFYTSTRFELNYEFAKEMFLRAHYLLVKLYEYKGRWEDFQLPREVLLY